jgi:outer membrane receptor protein involved in Fe transport
MKNKFLLLGLFCLFTKNIWAQNNIFGNIKNQSGQEILNASVKATNLQNAVFNATSDASGNYKLSVPNGVYLIEYDGKGYARKIFESVPVADSSLELNVVLGPLSKKMTGVTVKSTIKKENIQSLITLQKNSNSIMDAISAEAIKQIPSRNTADVMKRISGITLVDNKFIVVRGLSDRYNAAYLNGSPLPSTDPDKKAFAFDIFPSNVLDNIIVIKAVTPDVPAELAGGYISLNTKEGVKANEAFAQLGLGVNTNVIQNGFKQSNGGGTDFLGFDDGIRKLPGQTPNNLKLFNALTLAEKVDLSKNFNNTFGINNQRGIPNSNLQASLARKMELGKIKLGLIGAISYSNNFRSDKIFRNDISNDIKDTNFSYNDLAYRQNAVTGAMLNIGADFGKKQKISFKNFVNQNTELTDVERTGRQPSQDFEIKSYGSSFVANTLITSQLQGSHAISEKQIIVDWGVGYNKIVRDLPDFRNIDYKRSLSIPNETYLASVPFLIPNMQTAGRFFSKLNEDVYNAKLDVSIPFSIKNEKQKIKVGTFLNNRDRDFNARRFGYVTYNQLSPTLALEPSKIFEVSNMSTNGLHIEEATQPTDAYTATSSNMAAFVMLENSIAQKLKLVWGARYENFNLTLNSSDGLNDKVYSRKYNNLLPSISASYALNEKTNLRANYAKTISRPEFREIAPFAFFDFANSAVVQGNDSLTQATIANYDLRYELFPDKGEILSFSIFYKSFKNPIEQNFFSTGAGSQTRSFLNSDKGSLVGAETEFRKGLGFINDKNILKDMSVFGNFALMQSTVEYTYNNILSKRPMQGQSNYIANLGLSYMNTKYNFASTLVYNNIGPRIVLVGNDLFPNVWEKSRDLIDWQISKELNKKLELSLGVNDLLNASFIQFQNADNSSKYTNNSVLFVKSTTGTRIGFSARYKLQ